MATHAAPAPDGELAARFLAVRQRTMALCAPLSPEDHVVQPMEDASPAKWHLAHTTWFFEAFVLGDEPPFDPAFEYLFNSYYEAVGPRVARAHRGFLSRPPLAQIHAYRASVDDRVVRAIDRLDAATRARLELGLHHEQQHQELILTDLKYMLGTQPLAPTYRALVREAPRDPVPLAWRDEPGGIVEIGADDGAFAFDNERPRHRALIAPFRIAARPVSNAEVLGFIAAGGYRDHRHWLSDGWHAVKTQQWHAPLHWIRRDDAYAIYDLTGLRAVDPSETACHLSLYEADAIARWLGARLPSEAEWETVAQRASPDVAPSAPLTQGNFADADRLHPGAAGDGLAQLYGDVWEWTASSYGAYPGFRPLDGALGEYNGKFMSGQHVLRGGSCFTPAGHLRRTYRNFFPPSARWQMTGVRLVTEL